MVKYGSRETRWARIRDQRRDAEVVMNIDTMVILPKNTVICQQCDLVVESFMTTCKMCDYKNVTRLYLLSR